MPVVYLSVAIDGLEAETDQAYLLQIGDGKLWVPKSCVEEDTLTGLEEFVPIAAWFIEKNDLDMYVV